jgi:hypothetical protein
MTTKPVYQALLFEKLLGKMTKIATIIEALILQSNQDTASQSRCIGLFTVREDIGSFLVAVKNLISGIRNE